MRKLIRLIIDNPIAVLLVVSVIVCGGLFSLLHLPVSLFPGLDVPVVNVVSHYPGAASEDVELLITRPLEDRIRTITGVHRVSSTSIEGISQISVEFNQGTRLNDARQQVQAVLSSEQSNLPAEVVPRIENIGTTLQEVAGYVVYGGGSTVDLRTVTQTDIASRLMSVEGVSNVEVLGGDEPAYIVQLNPAALPSTHLTISDITSALANYNTIADTDFLNRGSKEYFIRGDSRLQSIADILAIPVISSGANSIFLRDIATVKAGYVPRHYEITGNGVPAVSFMVSKQDKASTINVLKGIDRELTGVRALLPAGAQIHKFYDQSEIVKEARNSLFLDLLIGALLAVAVLFFFMGSLRATLIVTATIPITLLATIGLMQLYGMTFNVITLSALTLAVGMVIDDAIIVTENIIRHRQNGKAGKEASIDGAVEIAAPDASGTFTTIAAFAPLLFIGSIVGLFARPFGLIVSIALLASLIVSLSFVPLMTGIVQIKSTKPALGARLLSWFDRMLQKIMDFTFSHRGLTIFSGHRSTCIGRSGSLAGTCKCVTKDR